MEKEIKVELSEICDFDYRHKTIKLALLEFDFSLILIPVLEQMSFNRITLDKWNLFHGVFGVRFLSKVTS